MYLPRFYANRMDAHYMPQDVDKLNSQEYEEEMFEKEFILTLQEIYRVDKYVIRKKNN
jgi:hypothetical protein